MAGAVATAVSLSGSATEKPDETAPTTSTAAAVDTTEAATTPVRESTSSTAPPTTSGTTIADPALREVYGLVRDFIAPLAGYSYTRTDDGGFKFGPAVLNVEDEGRFIIPADSVVRRRCNEFGFEDIRTIKPCYVRLVVDENDEVTSMIVLAAYYEPGREPYHDEPEGVFINGLVSSVTLDQVQLVIDSAGNSDWFAIADDAFFSCFDEIWHPPELPGFVDELIYQGRVDLRMNEIIELSCFVEF